MFASSNSIFQIPVNAVNLLHFLDDVFREIFQVVIAGIERNAIFSNCPISFKQAKVSVLPAFKYVGFFVFMSNYSGESFGQLPEYRRAPAFILAIRFIEET